MLCNNEDCMMPGGLAWACHREGSWEMIFIAYHACVNYCYSDAVIFATCLVQKVNYKEASPCIVNPKPSYQTKGLGRFNQQ